MQVRTPSAVAPATTRTRPAAWRTTVSSTRTRSLSFMRATSLVTPSAVRPLTPAPMKRSITRFRLSRSRSPAAVKGVGRTEYTPSSFTRFPPKRIASTLLLYPVHRKDVTECFHRPDASPHRCRTERGTRRRPSALGRTAGGVSPAHSGVEQLLAESRMVAEGQAWEAHHTVHGALPRQLPGGVHSWRQGRGGGAPLEAVQGRDENHRPGAALPGRYGCPSGDRRAQRSGGGQEAGRGKAGELREPTSPPATTAARSRSPARRRSTGPGARRYAYRCWPARRPAAPESRRSPHRASAPKWCARPPSPALRWRSFRSACPRSAPCWRGPARPWHSVRPAS